MLLAPAPRYSDVWESSAFALVLGLLFGARIRSLLDRCVDLLVLPSRVLWAVQGGAVCRLRRLATMLLTIL